MKNDTNKELSLLSLQFMQDANHNDRSCIVTMGHADLSLFP